MSILGLSLHTFHGNFFVRSTDLLAMANVNPDSALAAQVQLEENLTGQQTVCFQAALLYTSSKGKGMEVRLRELSYHTSGDRRIRVHTMCLPVISDFSSVFHYFDLKATTSLLAKMGQLTQFSTIILTTLLKLRRELSLAQSLRIAEKL